MIRNLIGRIDELETEVLRVNLILERSGLAAGTIAEVSNAAAQSIKDKEIVEYIGDDKIEKNNI